jgi:YVTN family beta-propeller protein
MHKHLQFATMLAATLLSAGVWMQAQPPATGGSAAEAAQEKAKRPPRPPRPGVGIPETRREMASLKPLAVFPVEGTPDWQAVTEDAVWVSNGPRNTVHRLDAKTNQVVAVVEVGQRPCSGLAAGFGSVWVPNCGSRTVSRVDTATNQVVATIPVGPANSEGGIAASPEAVWMATDLENGTLVRIDPASNRVTAEIDIAPGSVGVAYGEGFVWVSSVQHSVVTKVNPKTNQVEAVIAVGPNPRFLTTGAGSVWTLNQGDGTVTRVDAATNQVITHIPTGAPGAGGEIAYGEGYVWFTVFEIPITQIDPATNTVVKQWFGEGGDAIRIGHGSIWLSNLRQQNLWRIDPKQP